MPRERDDSPCRPPPSLLRDGYLVIPSGLDLDHWRTELNRELASMPEFVRDATQYVGGGFAALANASSFHNPTVRRLRQLARECALPHLRDLGYARFEVLIDRVLSRPPNTAPTAEAWHRDEAPRALRDDLVLGGWLNLDSRDQHLSCVPGSQLLRDAGRGGFAPIDKAEHAHWKARSRLVRVPPGHLLLFCENMVHEVLAARQPYTVQRLFLGWRLTDAAAPLLPDIDQLLDDQAVVPLKSGQVPRTYPKLWWTNHRAKLPPLAAQFVPRLRELRIVQSGAAAGQQCWAPLATLPSLRQLDALYAPYTAEERAMYRPQPWE